MDGNSSLAELRAHFLATSSSSMPIAGMLFWSIVGIAALRLTPNQLAMLVLFGSGAIFPLAVLIDRLRGENRIQRSSSANPLTQLFLRAIAMVVLLWPLAILGAQGAHDADLVVLGGAILMGIIWIPYGWAADDPSALHHAVGRCIACYAAFVWAPDAWKATAISAAVVLSYVYSLARMRRPGSPGTTG